MKTANYLLLALFPIFAYSQETQPLWFHTVHSLPNFSPSYNYFIHHDSKGFVWVSSTGYLNRFDGKRVKKYYSIKGDSTSILDDNVQSNFYEDQKGNLWFSTASGINCYLRTSDDFKQIHKHKLPCQSGNIHVFFLEQNTYLWFTTGDEIYRYNINGPIEEAELLFQQSDINRYAVDTSSDGSVRRLFAKGSTEKSDFRYWKFNDGQVTGWHLWFDENNSELTPKIIKDILVDKGIAWVSTEEGLVRWEFGRGWKLVGGAEYSNAKLAIWNGQLVGWPNDNEPFIYDINSNIFRKIEVHTLTNTDLNHQKCYDINIDKQGNLWVSFSNSGFMFANLNKTKFNSLPKQTAYKGNKINYSYWHFMEDEDGMIWHGSSTQGLFQLNPEGVILNNFTTDPKAQFSLPDNWVTSIVAGIGGRFWVGTRSGLVYFNPSAEKIKFITVNDANTNGKLDISHMQQTSFGILVSTTNQGVYLIDEYSNPPSLQKIWDSGNAYVTIFEDHNCNIYIDRNNEDIEIFEFNENGLAPKGALPVNGFVSGFQEDIANNKLWAGTFSGLAKIDLTDSIYIEEIFTEKNGLPTKNIHGILSDNYKIIWMGTPQGLVKFNTTNEKCWTFNLADGTRSFEYNLTAAVKLRNGNLWFGGSDGITVVDSNGINKWVRNEPKMQINELAVNYESVPSDYLHKNTIELPYEQNTISFEIIGTEYSDPANNQLRYFLKGIDKNTLSVGRGLPLKAYYPNLPHGDYTLYVQGENSDGFKGKFKPLYSVKIKPHWTNTWWFKLMVGLFISAIFYLLFRIRINQVKRKEEMLRKEAVYKQKEAEFQKLEAEAKQQMAETETAILRLQMNPHFIFNSMNSINSYILEKDIDTASDYLNRFSKLMRMILNLAAKKYISVFEEQELLERYMEAESMRFKEKFDYEVIVDEEIEPDDTILPTMILQPFVENAIWHGLKGKKGKGKITARFQISSGRLICSVEDNGVGREAAKRAKSSNQSHESKALGITARRLELLEKETGKPASSEIFDLKNNKGMPLGTKVVLTLPLI